MFLSYKSDSMLFIVPVNIKRELIVKTVNSIKHNKDTIVLKHAKNDQELAHYILSKPI